MQWNVELTKQGISNMFLHCSFYFVYSFGSFKSIVVLWFNLLCFLEIFQRLSAKFRGWIIYSVIYFDLTQSTKCIVTKRNHYRGYIYTVAIKISRFSLDQTYKSWKSSEYILMHQDNIIMLFDILFQLYMYQTCRR